ncbi:MAG: hypothetical protein IT431_16960 [Phycisphaerales bacterium]|nr:hypothetical protein [Phycisphaerales bacterium]
MNRCMECRAGLASVAVLVSVLAGASAGGVLDQEQLLYNGGTSARTLPGYTVWQSFTAGLTGTLDTIEMGFFNDMSGDGVLRIYEGRGTHGALLQQLNVPVVGITQQGPTWNLWAVNAQVTAGLQYTFELTPNADTLPDPYGVCIGAYDPYTRGVFGINDPSGSYETEFDMVFRTRVAVPAPAGLAVLGLGGLVLRRRR